MTSLLQYAPFDMTEIPIPKSAARHPFTPEEDAFLYQMMTSRQCSSWDELANQMSGRTARQCRDRWMNYLSPTVRTGPWIPAEDELLVAKINELGRTWSALVPFFSGRSESDIKNRWYSHLRYRTVQAAGNALMLLQESEQNRRKRNRKPACPKQAVMLLLAKRPEEPPRQVRTGVEAASDPFANIEDWIWSERVPEPFAFDLALF
jgi:hypothetical protein